jgi:hypothetical protein
MGLCLEGEGASQAPSASPFFIRPVGTGMNVLSPSSILRSTPGMGISAVAALIVSGGCASGPEASAPSTPAPTPAEAPATAPPSPATPEPVLFSSDGRPAGLEEIVEAAGGVDVVFVGERHGDPAVHRFQLHLLDALIRAAVETDRELVLSMEMFERDVQLALDEYLQGLITESQFLAVARPWPNYRRDYRPLLERAREEGIRVVAANAPRRYANRVSRLGAEALHDLSPEAMESLPPLPFPEASDAYRKEWEERMTSIMAAHGHDGGGGGIGHGPHGGDGPLQAQALWDATMAFSIHGTLPNGGADREDGEGRGRTEGEPEEDGILVLHLTGSFHVENRTGTPEALRHYRPGVRDLVITTRRVPDPARFEAATASLDARALADFILLTPEPHPEPEAHDPDLRP